MNTLFNTTFETEEASHHEECVRLRPQTYDLQESNVQLKLTIVDAVGFGDQINKDERQEAGKAAPPSLIPTPPHLLTLVLTLCLALFTLSRPHTNDQAPHPMGACEVLRCSRLAPGRHRSLLVPRGAEPGCPAPR